MIIATYSKLQDSTTTFGIDWSEWLGTRIITVSTWDVGGLTGTALTAGEAGKNQSL